MRRLAVLLAGLTVLLAAPAAAEANPAPSLAYCAGVGTEFPGSLRGGGSLAPDNDIRQRWDWYQSQGINIVRSYWSGEWYTQTHDVQVKWIYEAADGRKLAAWAICYDYRNDFVGGSYHDSA